MTSSKLELVNEAYTVVTLPNNTKVIFKINQAFLDRDLNQTEELLQPHQAKSFGVIVDDCAKIHLATYGKPGGQYLQVGNKQCDIHFDGRKCYFKIKTLREADLKKYEIFGLTFALDYNPQRRYSRHAQSYSKLYIAK